jgi:hypothetical protein
VSNTAGRRKDIICDKNLKLFKEVDFYQNLAKLLCPLVAYCNGKDELLRPKSAFLEDVAAVFEEFAVTCNDICRCGTCSSS